MRNSEGTQTRTMKITDIDSRIISKTKSRIRLPNSEDTKIGRNCRKREYKNEFDKKMGVTLSMVRFIKIK